MSDYVRLDPWSVVTWAEQVRGDRPGDGELRTTDEILADLENILLVNRRNNTRRLSHPPRGRLWVACRPAVYVLLMLAPLLMPLVMAVGLHAAGDGADGAYRPAVAFVTALSVSLFTAAYLAVFYLARRGRHPRRRHVMMTIFTCLYAVFTALTLVVCHAYADRFGVPVDWYVLPLWVLLALCVASAVQQLRSPPDPAWGHVFSAGGEWSPDKTRLETRRLHPEDRARMLEERDQAVRILIGRGLLTGVDADDLSTRPLGELHLEPEGSHARPH